MLTLPDGCVTVLHPLATLVCSPAWLKAQILLAGGILAPVQRTLAAAPLVMGRSGHLDYARYHEVLNRSVWPLRQAARSLLLLLLNTWIRSMVRWCSASGETWNGAEALTTNPWASAAMQCGPAGATWSGPAACGLGLGSGPTGRMHAPGFALHRSVGGPGGDPGMVCAALATGGHPVSSTGQALSGGAGSPGRGDPTPVAGSSDCPYYANPEGALLLDHLGSPSSAATTTPGPSRSSLVGQAVADLRGCHCSGAPPLGAGV